MIIQVGPLGVVLLLALWTWALWGPAMRSWRTVAMLMGTTAGYVALATMPGTAFVALRVVLLFGSAAVLLFKSSWFMTRSEADLAFDQAYWRAQQRITDLARQRLDDQIDRAAFARGLAELIPVFDGLRPPDTDWAALLQDTVLELQRWLANGGLDPEVPEPDLRVAPLRERWRRIRAERTQFWGRAPSTNSNAGRDA